MKNLLFLFAAAFVLFTSSCREDDASLELNFTNTYGTEPLVLGETYDLNGVNIQFDKVRYFVSDIKLESDDSNVDLVDVDYLNFEDSGNLENATNGKSIFIKDVETGEYNSVSMNLGLTAALNDLPREDVPSDSPLNDGGYWAPWASYIFATVEFKADLDRDDIFEHNLVYHVGGNEARRVVIFDNTVQVSGGDEPRVGFAFDLKQALDGFDIENITAVHSQKDIMNDLADKFQDSFRFNFFIR